MLSVSRVDEFQREHPIIGLPLAVFYKYFDDQGPFLAAVVAYYAFIAVFPLLLISTSVLGFFLQGNPDLRTDLLNSALSQFPIVGDQLASEDGLKGSTVAIVAGSVAAIYGALNLGQACQNAANAAWAVPRNSRANPFLQRIRSLGFLLIAGIGILALAILSTVLSNPSAFGDLIVPGFTWIVRAIGIVVTVGIFVGLFRIVSADHEDLRMVWPGAIVTTIGWQAVQVLGTTYVTTVVSRASETVNQTFALVLGLMGFLYLSAIVVVFGIEVNVVRSLRLYPRALLTPFTDNVSLTDADKRAYSMYARAQRHKGFQQIVSTFDPPAARDTPPPPS